LAFRADYFRHNRANLRHGPAVAGVIGQRKFAYDLWGDTVNLASRLEAYGEPGRILVSDAVAQRLADRYEFGPPRVVDVKGKGPTPARFLLARLPEPGPNRACEQQVPQSRA
jgi:adenylate cyclase